MRNWKIGAFLLFLFFINFGITRADYCAGGGTVGTAFCPNAPSPNGWYCIDQSGNNCAGKTSKSSCESFQAGGFPGCGNPVNCIGCHWVVTSQPTPTPGGSTPPGGCGGCQCQASAGGGYTQCVPNSGCPATNNTACCQPACGGGGGGGGGNPPPACGGPREAWVSVNGGPPTTQNVTVNSGDGITYGGMTNPGYTTGFFGPGGLVYAQCSSHPNKPWYVSNCPDGTLVTGSPGQVFQAQVFEPIGDWWIGASCADVITVTINSCTAPSAPTLGYPPNGTQFATNLVDLIWDPVTNWGNCPGGNVSYRVYINTTGVFNVNQPTVTISTPPGNPTPTYAFQGNYGSTYYWQIRAVNSGGVVSTPSETRNFSIQFLPWWQVSGSGVIAVGDVGSQLTTGNQFITDPAGVVVSGSGQTNFNSQPVSSKNWVVADSNSDVSSGMISGSDFATLQRNIIGLTTPTDIASPVTSVVNLLAGTPVDGVYYVRVNGNLDLASTGPLDLGNNKVVLLVTGNVNIKNTINLNDNQGFFVLAASGNIAIDPSVGNVVAANPSGITPHLEGIFFAGGNFSTGSGSEQVRIDGIVTGMSSVVLERQVLSSFAGEYFNFRPEMAVYAPKGVSRKNLIWEEVAP